MYSLSSQLFEGLTEYIVDTKTNTFKDGESQKGKFGSGRIMANIIRNESSKQEKKFLHDYSYTLFEKALADENKFLELEKDNIDERLNHINDFDFVKIRGKVIFNDAKLISLTLDNFNSFAGALGYLQYKDLKDQEEALKVGCSKLWDFRKFSSHTFD